MSKKNVSDNAEISPEVKKWLEIGLRILVIILSAIAGDAADVVNFLIP